MAVGFGIAVGVAVYVLTNVAYIRALGPARLAASLAPAADTMRVVMGPIGASLMAVGVIVSTIGFVNSGILSAPRMLQAMSADGLFFRFASRLHPRYRTPAGGIVIQAAWAVALALSGTYGQLLDYVVFGDWIFFGLIVATLFAYRRRDALTGITPNVFRVPGYPAVPALFVIVAAYVVASVIWSNPRNALLGVLLIAVGVPAFVFWRRPSTPQVGVVP